MKVRIALAVAALLGVYAVHAYALNCTTSCIGNICHTYCY